MRFSFDVIALIRDQVRNGGVENEVGGLLFGRAEEVFSIFAATNVAADPRVEFQIDPYAMDHVLLNAEAKGEQLLGSYHSHPSGEAHMSIADAATARQTGKLLIVGTTRKSWQWRLWDPLAGGEVDFTIAPPYNPIRAPRRTEQRS